MKAAYGVFKKNSPARRSDHITANDLEERHDDNSMTQLFPLKFCGHRWLENGKVLTRFLEDFFAQV